MKRFYRPYDIDSDSHYGDYEEEPPVHTEKCLDKGERVVLLVGLIIGVVGLIGLGAMLWMFWNLIP